MSRACLTSSMFVRLGVSVLACISLPALVQGVAAFSENGARTVSVPTRVATWAGENPYGAIVIDDAPKSNNVSASAQGFRHLRADYFSRMITVTDTAPPGSEARRMRRAPAPSGPLPVGCEALGGVATVLDQVAGRCLS